jgi:hypothetical protein
MESYPKIDVLMLGLLAFASALLLAILQGDVSAKKETLAISFLCVAVTSGVAGQLFARHAAFKKIPRYRPFGYACFISSCCVFSALFLVIAKRSTVAAIALAASSAAWFVWLWIEGGANEKKDE